MHQRKAASVLPEPVGAQMRVCEPLEIAGQPSACACVGSAKAERNQSWVADAKGASGSGRGAAATERERRAKGPAV